MISVERLVTFSAVAFVLIVVPGPSVLFVVSRGIALGRRAALATVVGNAAGVFVQIIAVAAGIGAIIERSVLAFNIMKLAGAAYLVLLGVQALRHRRALTDVATASGGNPIGLRRIVADGLKERHTPRTQAEWLERVSRCHAKVATLRGECTHRVAEGRAGMKRKIVVCLSAVGLVLAFAAPASAHNLVVENPNTGETVTTQWVGGLTVPEPAQDAPPMFGPFSLPPSHAHGLVMACHGTASSPAVTFLAPPFFTGCVHGQP